MSWIDITTLLVLPVILPLLVGFFTKAELPAFWKRLALFTLTFLTTALTEVVETVSTGAAYTSDMAIFALVKFFATYLLAEGTYHGFLKAPLVAPEDNFTITTLELEYIDNETLTVAELKAELDKLGVDYPAKASKANLIELLEANALPAEVSEASVEVTPGKSIASIVAASGVK